MASDNELIGNGTHPGTFINAKNKTGVKYGEGRIIALLKVNTLSYKIH